MTKLATSIVTTKQKVRQRSERKHKMASESQYEKNDLTKDLTAIFSYKNMKLRQATKPMSLFHKSRLAQIELR